MQSLLSSSLIKSLATQLSEIKSRFAIERLWVKPSHYCRVVAFLDFTDIFLFAILVIEISCAGTVGNS